MNEPAIKLEEQIISLFQDRETQVWQGWILKKMGGRLLVYPLYYKYSQGSIPDNIRKCEEISHRSGLDCVFRIVEHTNYHLSSILTDNGYLLKECGVVGEWNLAEDAGNLCIGGKLQELLFLPDGNLPGVGIEDILRFSVDNGVTRILADIPGKEELPEQYGRAGFRRAYLYRCYQKEDTENGFTE